MLAGNLSPSGVAGRGSEPVTSVAAATAATASRELSRLAGCCVGLVVIFGPGFGVGCGCWRGGGRGLWRRCLRLRFRQGRDRRRRFLGLRRFLWLGLLGGSSGRRNLRSGFEQPRRDLYAADHDQGGGAGNDQRARALTRIFG